MKHQTGTGRVARQAIVLLVFIHCARGNCLTPEQMARAVGDGILLHKDVFLVWNYGGALIVDGLWKANETFSGLWFSNAVETLLNRYLSDPISFAYKAVHNKSILHGSTIGDEVGLFPISYLNRVVSYSSGPGKKVGYSNITDMQVVRYIADNYVLNWPTRLPDGCVSRNHGWPGQAGHDSFLWGDDQYMGLTLVSRVALATGQVKYAKFAAQQVLLFEKHMRDKTDGLYYHGFNAADNDESCCKWGRANGWGLFSHVEVMAAVEAFPELEEEAALVLAVLGRHLEAIMPFQGVDGRWRQLVNDTESFLETSCTAMFTSAIARSIVNNWIDVHDRKAYIEAAQKGFSGLSIVVDMTNGTVSGVCSGTGIQTSADAYLHRPTDYLSSGPGGLGSVLSAAVDIHRLNTFLAEEQRL